MQEIHHCVYYCIVNSAAGAAGTTPASTTAASSGLGSLTGFKPAAPTTAAATTAPGLSVGGFKSTVSQAAPVLGGLLSGPSAVTTAAAADAKYAALFQVFHSLAIKR